jgi:hypothetical protein
MSRRRILLLLADQDLEEFMTAALAGHAVTVVKAPDDMPVLTRTGSYDLVIVTNFGVGPHAALDAVPMERSYPAMMITGYIDTQIEAKAARKHVPVLRVPIDPRALRWCSGS